MSYHFGIICKAKFFRVVSSRNDVIMLNSIVSLGIFEFREFENDLRSIPCDNIAYNIAGFYILATLVKLS